MIWRWEHIEILGNLNSFFSLVTFRSDGTFSSGSLRLKMRGLGHFMPIYDVYGIKSYFRYHKRHIFARNDLELISVGVSTID